MAGRGRAGDRRHARQAAREERELSTQPVRLVLDTNVVASGILWDGTPRLLLQAAREKRVELFTITAMLAELTDILGRKFARKIAASQLTIDQLVDGYAQLASVVRPVATPRIAPDLRMTMGSSAPRSPPRPISSSPGTSRCSPPASIRASGSSASLKPSRSSTQDARPDPGVEGIGIVTAAIALERIGSAA